MVTVLSRSFVHESISSSPEGRRAVTRTHRTRITLLINTLIQRKLSFVVQIHASIEHVVTVVNISIFEHMIKLTIELSSFQLFQDSGQATVFLH